MPHIRRTIAQAVIVLMIAAAFILAAPAHPADAATECVTFELAYEVRPGPAQAIIGVTIPIDSWDLPDHWLGMPGTVHVETANGPSVHWNNYLTLVTNGFTTNVTGTEDLANGVRIGDSTINAIGADLAAAYTIGVRDSRDVPGVEGASLEGTVTICAILPDVTTTTTTTASSTTTTTGGGTTSSTNGTTTSSTTTPATSTTAPTGSTTPPQTFPPQTFPPHTDPPRPPSTTIPPETPPTLPFTGVEDAGAWLAVGALMFLVGAVLVSRLAVKEVGK